MADVMVMKDIETTASFLGIDFFPLDLNSIHLPPGQDFGIPRYNTQFIIIIISNYVHAELYINFSLDLTLFLDCNVAMMKKGIRI